MVVRSIISIFFYVIELAILARALLSWLPISGQNGLVNFLHTITEPILAPIRGLIEKSSFGSSMMFDVSPIIALLLMEIIRNILLSIIRF